VRFSKEWFENWAGVDQESLMTDEGITAGTKEEARSSLLREGLCFDIFFVSTVVLLQSNLPFTDSPLRKSS
jgi:hypothetical protein